MTHDSDKDREDDAAWVAKAEAAAAGGYLSPEESDAFVKEMRERGRQIIYDLAGRPEYVLVPVDEYWQLCKDEDEADAAQAKEVMARVDRGEEQVLDWEEVDRELGLDDDEDGRIAKERRDNPGRRFSQEEKERK